MPGSTYNTFPLMDGRLVPDGYAMLHPFIRNLTENVAAVQFDHRLLATMTLILVSALATLGWRSGLPRPLSACLAAAVAGQYLLGVTTLLLVVPVPVAALHQSRRRYAADRRPDRGASAVRRARTVRSKCRDRSRYR